ncbi:MAG: hypothetical protein ACHQAX_05085 [Gammaproteobacteria bacterium]
MFKPFVIVGMLTLSVCASANSMSQDPKNSGFVIPSDIGESRQHYEKQSRVTYAGPAVEEPEVSAETAKETTEPAKEPAKLTPRSRSKGRSGAMRF